LLFQLFHLWYPSPPFPNPITRRRIPFLCTFMYIFICNFSYIFILPFTREIFIFPQPSLLQPSWLIIWVEMICYPLLKIDVSNNQLLPRCFSNNLSFLKFFWFFQRSFSLEFYILVLFFPLFNLFNFKLITVFPHF